MLQEKYERWVKTFPGKDRGCCNKDHAINICARKRTWVEYVIERDRLNITVEAFIKIERGVIQENRHHKKYHSRYDLDMHRNKNASTSIAAAAI